MEISKKNWIIINAMLDYYDYFITIVNGQDELPIINELTNSLLFE
jgi:hypothetical protein